MAVIHYLCYQMGPLTADVSSLWRSEGTCGECRGVFGCHTALVLRRLTRVCERCYNCWPRFVMTSATVANPQQHAQELLGGYLCIIFLSKR